MDLLQLVVNHCNGWGTMTPKRGGKKTTWERQKVQRWWNGGREGRGKGNGWKALWFRATKNRVVSTRWLAHLFTCTALSRAPLPQFVDSLLSLWESEWEILEHQAILNHSEVVEKGVGRGAEGEEGGCVKVKDLTLLAKTWKIDLKELAFFRRKAAFFPSGFFTSPPTTSLLLRHPSLWVEAV